MSVVELTWAVKPCDACFVVAEEIKYPKKKLTRQAAGMAMYQAVRWRDFHGRTCSLVVVDVWSYTCKFLAYHIHCSMDSHSHGSFRQMLNLSDLGNGEPFFVMEGEEQMERRWQR